MRVGIIGAGMAGLAAARALKQAGVEAVILEKSRGPGGRVHTRSKNGFVWDTGATSVAPRGKAIESMILNELPTDDLVEIQKPIYIHEGLRVTPGDSSRKVKRYTYRSGIQKLAFLLADGLDIRYNTSVDKVTRNGEMYAVNDEIFDALILTPPIPQTTQILWSLEESRAFANAKYRPCISVLLGFDQPTPTVPYFALLEPEQSHPLTWLSLESGKSPDRAPEGQSTMVAQLSPRFSLEHYAKPDEYVLEATLSFIRHLYGANFTTPVEFNIKHWKYSQPDNIARFESVNLPGSKLLIASDGIVGGRIEEAYECGVKTARLLISK